MTTPLNDLLARVPSLDGPDAAYRHTVVGETIVVSDPADPEYSLTAELDGAAHTFRLTEVKPAQPTGPRRFDAGGIYNAAKRNALRGHMPQRRTVKENLLAFLERAGWKRAR
ncbi:MAG: hypothetical protein KF761_13055 [Salinibacterium sp.]|nr:hypothetical protein [Salinibacterium sp.]